MLHLKKDFDYKYLSLGDSWLIFVCTLKFRHHSHHQQQVWLNWIISLLLYSDKCLISVYQYLSWIWRTLFQINFAMLMPSLEIMFWKRALHKYVPIYSYIHMWKALDQNTILERGISIASSFSGMTPKAFKNERALHI